MASVLFDNSVEVPLHIGSLHDFRAWSHAPGFPGRGRIDYLEERIEIDMSPEDLFTHGTVKSELVAVLQNLAKSDRRGHVFSDRTRVALPKPNASAEPDIVFLSYESIATGPVRLVPTVTGEAGRFVEIEGPPNLVAEIVSDTSEEKDYARLPRAYFAAGMPEYWLVDARGRDIYFQIFQAGDQQYQAIPPGRDGYQ